MRFGGNVVRFSLGAIPMAGNLDNGSLVGLTDAGVALCECLSEGEVAPAEVPEECRELVGFLGRAGFFQESHAVLAPDKVYVHVTGNCNFSCVGCYSHSGGVRSAHDLPTEDWQAMLAKLGGAGVRELVVSGGEPFLRDDLASLVSCAKGSGIGEVVVLTNGSLVTAARLLEMAGSLDRLSLSIDRLPDGTRASVRSDLSWERARGVLDAAREAGVAVSLLATLHAGNAGEVSAYRAVADELGVGIGFSLLSGDVAELGAFVPTDEQLEGLACGEFSASGAGSLLPREASARRSCGAGVHELSVAADGRVFPCHMLHCDELCMGNLLDDSVASILAGPMGRRFASLGVDEFEGCRACELRYLCAGGCRARGYLSGRGLNAKDPYCALPCTYYGCFRDALQKRYHGKEG